MPWCSTKVDEMGKHTKGNWGNCDENCPLPPNNSSEVGKKEEIPGLLLMLLI